MNIDRYLIFDHHEEIINLTIKKINQPKLIIYGKKIEDIGKFNPKTVLCYQNENVKHECKRLKINCVHIYRWGKFHSVENKYISNLLIKPLNLSRIENDDKDYLYNFSIIEECVEIIAQVMKNFISGNNTVVNPGCITTTEILDFFEIEREARNPVKGEDRRSISSYPSSLSPIESFFQDKKESIVNIYLPTYHRLEKTKKSLLSILKDIKLSKYNVKLYIGDNSPNCEELRDWLKIFEQKNKDLIELYLGEKNIGKSGMVNYLYKNSRKCDYLFSIDSDMIVPEKTNFVNKMIFNLTRLDNCGLISSNQSECCQHWFGKSVNIISKNNLEIGYSEDTVGIAGGCIVMGSRDWEKVGMYKENHDIYTGDDGILTHNVSKILGKYVYISMNCSLIHPFPKEEEKEYTEWKMESWKRDQLNFLNKDYKGENKKGFYD